MPDYGNEDTIGLVQVVVSGDHRHDGLAQGEILSGDGRKAGRFRIVDGLVV